MYNVRRFHHQLNRFRFYCLTSVMSWFHHRMYITNLHVRIFTLLLNYACAIHISSWCLDKFSSLKTMRTTFRQSNKHWNQQFYPHQFKRYHEIEEKKNVIHNNDGGLLILVFIRFRFPNSFELEKNRIMNIILDTFVDILLYTILWWKVFFILIDYALLFVRILLKYTVGKKTLLEIGRPMFFILLFALVLFFSV